MDILLHEGVVVAEDLAFTETVQRDGLLGVVRLDGFVYTRDDGVLVTHKQLRVEYRRGAPYVSTSRYGYMAMRRRGGVTQPLFRYDNAHGGIETLHQHFFDHAGEPAGQESVDPEIMPYMDDVIRATAWLAGYLASRE